MVDLGDLLDRIRSLRDWVQDRLASLARDISRIWDDLADIYDDLDRIVDAARDEAQAWRSRLASLDDTLRSWARSELDELRSWARERLKDLREDLTEDLSALSQDLWGRISEIVDAAAEEAQAWRAGLTQLDAGLRTWVSDHIFELLLKQLDEGADELQQGGS